MRGERIFEASAAVPRGEQAIERSASGGARFVGRRYADSANRIAMPGYATADLALRWQAAPDTTVSLRAANVFDKQTFTTAYYTSNQWFSGPGRGVASAQIRRSA